MPPSSAESLAARHASAPLLAEIVAIGDELVSGQRLDTNSQWLSQQLGDLGIRVVWHSTVGDDLSANIDVFRIAAERADIVISTGGLGPTADDLTREALAGLAGVELELNEVLLEQIRQMFLTRGREMPERNRLQAMFPAGSRPIHNPHGTAPGIDLDWPRADRRAARLFALPGVPSEMRDMWHETVQPAILEMPGVVRRWIIHRRIKCFGVGESEVERRLPDLIQRDRIPRVGITASSATITLRITAEGESEEQAWEQIRPTEELIRGSLGELVFGEEDEELQHALVRLLQREQLSLAIGEAATAGLVSQWLQQVDPLGDCFRGGMILRPQRRGGAPTATESLENHELVRLAEQARRDFEAQIGLAIGGMDESSSTGDEQPAIIEMAVIDPLGPFVARHPVAGHPDIFIPRAAKQALDLVRRRLLQKARGSTGSTT